MWPREKTSKNQYAYTMETTAEKELQTKELPAGAVPRHVVLFPDGNRRWAKERGVDTLAGHLRGKENFEGFLSWCKERGVKVVTVFGFSTENWKRPEQEIRYLMDLFERYLGEGTQRFKQEGVKVRVIGERRRLPESLRKVIERVEEATKDSTEFQLNLAVSYGGRWDVVQAARKLAEQGKEITEETIAQNLSTAGQPDPDLVIRAGGERRFSNFVLWQSAYAELYFSDKYWPDFTKEDLEKAFEHYASRQRRFGR